MVRLSVVQLRGCERCAWDLLTLAKNSSVEFVSHPLIDGGSGSDNDADFVVITGYARKSDEARLRELLSRGKKLILYGTCPYTGGIFGLMNQKGADVVPVTEYLSPVASVLGCAPSPDELLSVIEGQSAQRQPLCSECERHFTDEEFDKIIRVPDWSNREKCFNNLGLACSGVLSARCAQRCIDFDTPCRGCVGMVDDPPGRMIGYFGSLAVNLQVDTVATDCATDRLGDRPDEITRSLVDVVGTFFRFHLASHFKFPGRNPSTGDELADIMVARPIEEAPQIAATIYGRYGISVALNLIEAYEAAAGIQVSDETRELRSELRAAQDGLLTALDQHDIEALEGVIDKIRTIGGNEVLSNVYFGGFKRPVKSAKNGFDTYCVGPLEIKAVHARSEDGCSRVSFSTDEQGVIREWSCELRSA